MPMGCTRSTSKQRLKSIEVAKASEADKGDVKRAAVPARLAPGLGEVGVAGQWTVGRGNNATASTNEAHEALLPLKLKKSSAVMN